MIRTVDLVIAGNDSAALAAAVEALQRGQRVLIVSRARDARLGRRFRRCLRSAEANLVTVMTSAEIACVAGVDGVEAVVIRYTRTGRVCAVNASAFLSCNAFDEVGGDKGRCGCAEPLPRPRVLK